MSERLRAGWGGSVHPFLLCLKDLKLEHWGEHILRTCLGRAHTAHMFTDSTPPIPACPHPSPQAVPGPPGHAGLPGGRRQRGADGAGARGPGAGQMVLLSPCIRMRAGVAGVLACYRRHSVPSGCVSSTLCLPPTHPLAGRLVAGRHAARRGLVQVGALSPTMLAAWHIQTLRRWLVELCFPLLSLRRLLSALLTQHLPSPSSIPPPRSAATALVGFGILATTAAFAFGHGGTVEGGAHRCCCA